jgi:hypothetical protein
MLADQASAVCRINTTICPRIIVRLSIPGSNRSRRPDRAQLPDAMGGKRTPQYNGGPKRPASHSTIRTKLVNHHRPDVYQLLAQLRDEHLTDMKHMRTKLHDEHLVEMNQMRKNLGDANLFELEQVRTTLRGEVLAETDQLLNTSRDEHQIEMKLALDNMHDKHHAEIDQLCQRLDEHRRDTDPIFPWKPHFW